MFYSKGTWPYLQKLSWDKHYSLLWKGIIDNTKKELQAQEINSRKDTSLLQNLSIFSKLRVRYAL